MQDMSSHEMTRQVTTSGLELCLSLETICLTFVPAGSSL